LAALWGLVALVSLAGCVGYGYHIGNASLFDSNIETVYVPMFESNSFRRDLAERVTEAVIKEIESHATFKVVSDPKADTILTGKITSDTKHLLVQTLNGDPRDMEITLQVKVCWMDRRGNKLRDCPAIPIPADCVSVGAASDLVGEVGQSVATSQQRAIKRLAQQIVGLMETPW
jgi:hypothetical protein